MFNKGVSIEAFVLMLIYACKDFVLEALTEYSSAFSAGDPIKKRHTISSMSTLPLRKPLNNSWELLHAPYVPRNRSNLPPWHPYEIKESTGYRALMLLFAHHRSGRQ